MIIDHGTLTARSALCIKIEVQIRNIKTKFLLYKETFNFLLNTTHLTSATPKIVVSTAKTKLIEFCFGSFSSEGFTHFFRTRMPVLGIKPSIFYFNPFMAPSDAWNCGAPMRISQKHSIDFYGSIKCRWQVIHASEQSTRRKPISIHHPCSSCIHALGSILANCYQTNFTV